MIILYAIQFYVRNEQCYVAEDTNYKRIIPTDYTYKGILYYYLSIRRSNAYVQYIPNRTCNLRFFHSVS